MSPTQVDAGCGLDILLELGEDTVRLFAQQPQQLRLNLRCDPTHTAMAALLDPPGLARAKTLRADLLRIVVADRKPLRKNTQRSLPGVKRHQELATQIIRICLRHRIDVAVRQSNYSVHL